MQLVKIIACLLLPPLAAFLQVGLTLHFWINVVLCFFFWVPGIVHACWLVFTNKRN